MKRILSLLLSAALLIALLPAPAANAAISSDTYSEKMQAFIQDPRWAHGTSWGGSHSQSWAVSDWASTGCCAYCADFAGYVYGARRAWHDSGFTESADPADIRTGDIVHFRYSNSKRTSEHWIVVLERTGDTLYTAEGNAYLNGAYSVVCVTDEKWAIVDGTLKNLTNSTETCYDFEIYHYDFSDGDAGSRRPADLGAEFQAVLRNTDSGKTVTLDGDGYVRMDTATGGSEQLWKFVRREDGSYTVTSALTGMALKMSGTAPADPVAAASEDEGADSQRWYLYEQGSGYVLQSKQASSAKLVMAQSGSGDGSAVTAQLRDNGGLQIWTVDTDGALQLSGPALSVAAGNSESDTVFTWEDVNGETEYTVTIWEDTAGDGAPDYRIAGAESGCGITLPAGTYRACVEAVNFFGSETGNVVTFTVEKVCRHTVLGIENAVAATCTVEGSTGDTVCADCGLVLEYGVPVPSLGHVWNEGLCLVCGASESDPYRLYGGNRFETAFKVADQMKENLGIEKFHNIIVASGTNFADALAGSYLAAVKEAPILLSYEGLDDQVVDYIRDNLSAYGTVYILGGTGAVPASLDAALSGFNVMRLAGSDRFGTNLAILAEAGVGDKPILVCTALDFADSLSASASKLPILLAWGTLTQEQEAFLDGLNGNRLYIIGGETAVDRELEAQVAAYGQTERIGGGNRFETSVLIAEKFFEAPDSAVLAYAWNYPDGLCGGALAATMDAPLILTMTGCESAAAAYIQDGGIRFGTILGGRGLISDGAVRAVFGLDEAVQISVR